MTRLASTDLDVFPLCLGGNVFGWTADEEQSFAVLDAYAEAGGNFIDTADVYPAWVPGNSGGESEAIIGAWMAARGNRDRMVIATKVFSHPQFPGLSAANIAAAAEASLRRLQTDRIDLYYAHRDDEKVELTETLGAFDALVGAGKVRVLGASNYRPERLTEALAVSEREGLAAYQVVQDQYNLLERDYERTLRPVVAEHGLVELPYYALASGFLSGKYRNRADVDSARAATAAKYADERGDRVLQALDTIAAEHGCAMTTVALAWLAAQPTIGAPIASARTVAQVAPLVAAAHLELTEAELAELDAAGR
jgi:aryl-alcohol dehydrogenase-like predicted oxidoreductase